MSWAENKVVLVTGSSSGIGKQVAIHFAKLGARVVVTGRNQERVENAAAECDAVSSNRNKALAAVADISSRESLKGLIDTTINTFGQLDVLVNNAGIADRVKGTTDPQLMDVYDRIFATNVAAVLYLCHLAAPYLEATKGVIINVSSIRAQVALPILIPYCMSKAAVDMMTKCLALDLGPKGIRVVSINPGVVDTPIFDRLYQVQQKQEYRAAIREQTPIGRVGAVEDCAELVAFLASPQASWITGTNVTLDGGYSISRYMPGNAGKSPNSPQD